MKPQKNIIRLLTLFCVGLSQVLLDATADIWSNDVNYWQKVHGKEMTTSNRDDPGKPLFLTPLIETGQLDLAKNLSLVQLEDATAVTSYAGLLTVNPEYNSTMFFWYFLSQNDTANAPVILWLQGGPGSSDQYSIFYETGPFYVDENLALQSRNYSWNTNFNMLYIDNPVGTGFSFADSDEGYARNETTVSKDLYEALSQFFILFQEHRNNEFYIAGESYAGKYVPSIANEIDVRNEGTEKKINLKGISIGNGLIDPITMYNYGDYLFQLGLIDDQVHLAYMEVQADFADCMQRGDMQEAFRLYDYLINGDFSNGTLFSNATGMSNYFNFLYTNDNSDDGYSEILVETPEIRRAIHVGNLTNNDGRKVETFMAGDFLISTKPVLEKLLNKGYRTILYNGQLDLIVPYVFTQNMVNTLEWNHAAEFRNAHRVIWKVNSSDEEVAGYSKEFANLNLVLVRDAGHIVAFDQPRAAFDLISRFVNGIPMTDPQ